MAVAFFPKNARDALISAPSIYLLGEVQKQIVIQHYLHTQFTVT
jgi:hypothetical protein